MRAPRPRSASTPTETRPVASFLVSDYIGELPVHPRLNSTGREGHECEVAPSCCGDLCETERGLQAEPPSPLRLSFRASVARLRGEAVDESALCLWFRAASTPEGRIF